MKSAVKAAVAAELQYWSAWDLGGVPARSAPVAVVAELQ